MHDRIFEVRADKPFTDEEIRKGVMNPEQVIDWHTDSFDYIVDSDCERDNDIRLFLQPFLCGVFSVRCNELTLHQPAYDQYVRSWVKDIQQAAELITPDNAYTFGAWRDIHDLLPVIHRGEALVYDEDSEDVSDIHDFILRASTYRGTEEDGRKYYIGKIWDYHV